MKKNLAALLAALLLLTSIPAQAYTADRLSGVPRVPPAGMRVNGKLAALPAPGEDGAYDLRDADLTGCDLSGAGAALQACDFSTLTMWPDDLPEGFDPAAALEQAKDPGLNLRTLHAKGVTGKGVGIGIIDQTLLTGHQEYADRLRYYREHGRMATFNAQMHGPAVASIALGETVGVAPEALLYYIADAHQKEAPGGKPTGDVSNRAKDIDEFIALNRTLPEDEKIRVISISNGWMKGDPGAAEMDAAVKRANGAGIAVIWISDDDPLCGKYLGMGRGWMADPNGDAARPVWWLADAAVKGDLNTESLLVPIDSRALAAPQGNDAYAFYRYGGMSWAAPYVAGLYALAWQVKPGVTLADFFEAAEKTARPVSFAQEGEQYPLGKAFDPPALMEALAARASGK